MAGPPANASGSELWNRLTQLPRPTRDFTFSHRGTEVTVRLVVLVEQELAACRAAADDFAKRACGGKPQAGDLGYNDVYRNEIVVQVVCTACRDPQGMSLKSRAFPNADLAREQFTSDEWAVLFQAYCEWQADSGPIVSGMTTEEMDAWIEKLQEGASRSPLALLSSEQKSQLLLHLVSRLPKSPTASGSVGSPQSDPTPDPV
jgi:hypothetical protein